MWFNQKTFTMRKISIGTILLISLLVTSCKKDDERSCTTCSSSLTSTTFELCEESDGTASVNGENTGTPYNTYLSDLQSNGVECGH